MSERARERRGRKEKEGVLEIRTIGNATFKVFNTAHATVSSRRCSSGRAAVQTAKASPGREGEGVADAAAAAAAARWALERWVGMTGWRIANIVRAWTKGHRGTKGQRMRGKG